MTEPVAYLYSSYTGVIALTAKEYADISEERQDGAWPGMFTPLEIMRTQVLKADLAKSGLW